jgi:hypothetical protein
VLTGLRLENFKGFGKSTSIPLAPLTLIYGQNSAGKSSVLQSLLLLKQSVGDDRTQQLFAQPRLVTQGDLADLGTFLGIVHEHAPRRALRIGFDCTSDVRQLSGPTLQLDARALHSARVDLGFRYDRSEARSAQQADVELGLENTRGLRFHVGRQAAGARVLERSRRMTLDPRSQKHAADLVEWVFETLKVSAQGTKTLSKLPQRKTLTAAVQSERFRAQWAEEIPWNGLGFFPHTIEASGSAEESGTRTNADIVVNEVLELALQACSTAAISALQRVRYLGPLRAAPSRINEVSGNGGRAIGTSGEFAPALLAQDPDLLRSVNGWLRRLGISYRWRSRTWAPSAAGRCWGN